MQNQAVRDTNPELALRNLLFRKGLRYRVNLRPIPGLRRSADIVFTRQRLAIFVDGCFWHACPEHGTWPKANAEWWRLKLVTNTQRDRDTDYRFLSAGWHVMRIWEHEPVISAAERVVIALSDLTHDE
jgi:DNA mismatch endonuclease (patch repair protein)